MYQLQFQMYYKVSYVVMLLTPLNETFNVYRKKILNYVTLISLRYQIATCNIFFNNAAWNSKCV